MHPRGARRRACIAATGIALAAISATLSAQDARSLAVPDLSVQGLTIEEASRLAQSSAEPIRIRELAVQKARLAVDEAAGLHQRIDAYFVVGRVENANPFLHT